MTTAEVSLAGQEIDKLLALHPKGFDLSLDRITRLLSELGRGGMANVFLAVARGPGGVSKLVVLKALLPDFATEPDAQSK